MVLIFFYKNVEKRTSDLLCGFVSNVPENLLDLKVFLLLMLPGNLKEWVLLFDQDIAE